MKKVFYVIVIFILSLSLAISGCVTKKKPAPKPAPPTRMTPAPTPTPTPKTTPSKKPATAHSEAMKLAKTAEKVTGVKSATVVISGSTVFVGLETKPEVEAKKTEEIKTKVGNEIKKADTKVKTVNITTDPNLITRLKKVAKGIEGGKPVSSFAQELAEITRRIAPKSK